VIANVAAYGSSSVCEFVPGWFSTTMKNRTPDQVAVAFVDARRTGEPLAAPELRWDRVCPRRSRCEARGVPRRLGELGSPRPVGCELAAGVVREMSRLRG
jgi:hypothetical protein